MSAEGWQARWYAEMRSRSAATGLEAELVGARGAAPRSLLALYQRGYWKRLVDAVLDLYPGTTRALGGRIATALARDFVHEEPTRSPVLERVALGFGAWLSARDVRRSVKALAHLEAELLHALIAPARSGRRVRGRDLADVETFLLPVRLHDDVRCTTAPRESLRALELLRDGELGAEPLPTLTLEAAETAPVPVILHRPQGAVLLKRSSPLAVWIGGALGSSASLQEALMTIRGATPELLKDGLQELLDLEVLRYS
jgi:hypothetical protein